MGFALAFAAAVVAQPLQRVPNTTLTNLPPAPPVFGYAATNAFPGVTFTDPLAIATPPGETNRLFIVEQAGRIAVITNLAAPNRSVFLDISSRIVADLPGGERGLLGLAFHPGYASNGLFFIAYTGNTTTAVTGGTNSMHDVIARYQVSATNANVAATNETRIIAQRDEASNHNGGCLQFGPDGYLYTSHGDEGNQDDSLNNSQRIDKDFFSGILRLDVEKKSGNLVPNPHPSSTTNYLVPADNPFVGATSFNGSAVNFNNVRTELWAVGLRNPWRYSFDPQTGTMYCGDVGGAVREEVDVIIKGGNYGWAYREGVTTGPKSAQAPTGFTSRSPILDYAHGTATNQGNAVIGGVVYRGARIAQLAGAYVFGDNSSGHIWTCLPNGTNAVSFTRIFGSEGGVAGFGYDPRNGDVLFASQGSDTIRRVIYATNFTGAPLPATLAATGAFTNLATLAPAPGVVPYDLNAPFWSDHAIKTRWFSLPNTNLTITFNRTNNWQFPTGTVWVKHFELELTNGVPASRKRLETRFIVKNVAGVYGLTYRWTTPPTNALLVAEDGLDENFVINDGGILRTQVWHYPSRGECLLCHTPQGGFALGFNTAQLNRDTDYGSGPTNQLAALSRAGYFNTNITGLNTLPALAHPANSAASLEYRVRSYLAANCVQCHQPGGSAQAQWDARFSTPTASAGLVNGALINSGSDTNNRVLAPGSLANSILLARLANLGAGHMPPLATAVINTQAVNLISAWVTNELPQFQTFAMWQTAFFGSTNAPNAAATADPDEDGNRNQLEFLTGSNPTNGSDAWKVYSAANGGDVEVHLPQIANRGFEVQFTTNPFGATTWQSLDIPANRPFFWITNHDGVVSDAMNPAVDTYYRVRVFAP